MKNLIHSNIDGLYEDEETEEAPVTFQKIKKKNNIEGAEIKKKKDFCWSQKRGKTEDRINSF